MRARRPSGFNVAFLDVLACGLGGIILVFMLVKYHSESPGAARDATDDIARQHQEAAELTAANDALEKQLAARTEAQARDAINATAAAATARDATQKLIELTSQKIALEKTAAANSAAKNSPAKNQHHAQEHLIGVRVDGKRIVILLDRSASMAAEKLVDIIKLKARGEAAQRNSPKWQRAKSTVRWLVTRVPPGSEYVIIHYNRSADFLAGKNWGRGNDKDFLQKNLLALEELYPRDATDLHAAFNLTSTLRAPTDIYIVTDGLPTRGRRFRGCNKTTISGECREKIFYDAVKNFAHSGARVNVILLPVEGDPDAAYAYWLWASTTTGTMVSPAHSWP